MNARTPPEEWANDDIIRAARNLAEGMALTAHPDHPVPKVLRELARRYEAAISLERARWEGVHRAFGLPGEPAYRID